MYFEHTLMMCSSFQKLWFFSDSFCRLVQVQHILKFTCGIITLDLSPSCNNIWILCDQLTKWQGSSASLQFSSWSDNIQMLLEWRDITINFYVEQVVCWFMNIKPGQSRLKPTCPVHSPTTRSAINVSSVSPLLCDTITPQPSFWDILQASMDSVTLPIWLTCGVNVG